MPTLPFPTDGLYADLPKPSSEPPEDGIYYSWHFGLENWVVCDPDAPTYTEGQGADEVVLPVPPSWLFDDTGDGVWRPPTLPPADHDPENWYVWDEAMTSWVEVEPANSAE